MRMKDHELHPLPQHTQTHTEYNKLTGEGVRWMSQWVGASGEGCGPLAWVSQHRCACVTSSWTQTCEKITAPPIRLPVFHLSTQQLAWRGAPACADMRWKFTACLPVRFCFHKTVLQKKKCLQRLPAMNMDTVYLLQRHLWLTASLTHRSFLERGCD